MDIDELNDILQDHLLWLDDNIEGKRADLGDTDLRGANLSSANLSSANLKGANLSSANLSSANLSSANLRDTDLSSANLVGATLVGANLSSANLNGANLSSANLSSANLNGANLVGATLVGATLSSANLNGANLSSAKGLLNASTWLLAHFETTIEGIVVYKGLGHTSYEIPSKWMIANNTYIEEVVNTNRTDECGCGVNFATKDWIMNHYSQSDIWKCRIDWIDLADVCVPYNTDGKARCAKLFLIEKLNKGEQSNG